jgi:hypothetical protein
LALHGIFRIDRVDVMLDRGDADEALGGQRPELFVIADQRLGVGRAGSACAISGANSCIPTAIVVAVSQRCTLLRDAPDMEIRRTGLSGPRNKPVD